MAKLSSIIKGVRVRGIAGDTAVTITDTQWHGNSVLSVTYKTDQGALSEAMLYDFDEDCYVVEESLAWGFDADADDLRLVSEAYRIGLAHLFDPYLAIRTSAIEPLPHQISAVYQEMLPRLPLRYVLADDPGAGKTIMTGLLVKEMLARGDLKRCLIVAPGNLVEQWQDELWRKFGLKFSILTNEVLESSATGNAFDEVDLCIGRLDKLARNDEIQKKLRATSWDLVVCDEAHKMSATNFGNEPKYTKRYRLGQLLGDTTENLLLLTATPHNGKPADFRYFMALVDKDRFAGGNRIKNPTARAGSDAGKRLSGSALPDCDVSDVMRRLVKEELLKFDGRPLFPERLAYTVEYDLSAAEKELYDLVTQYVTEEFNRAERLGGKHRNSVGFALTILQRRLASSPEAIYQSLRRRRVRMESKLAEAKSSASGKIAYSDKWDVDAEDFDEDDYGTDEYEQMEDDVVDTASTAATAAELEAEIATLRMLECKANDVRISGEDRKWEELSRLLQDDSNMFGADGRREKLIIFTEHKDTLNYLAGKIGSLLGDAGAVLTIKGGMTRDERHRAEEAFKQDANVRILVATDAAGARVNSPASWTTRGKEHPLARLSGPCPGKVWHRVQELAGRARKRLPRGSANRDARSPSRDSKNAIAWPAPRTQPACSTPFTSSNSPATPQMRYAVASSKTRPITAGRRGIPSTTSGFSCAPGVIGSRSANKNDSARPSRQMRYTISVEVAYRCAQHVRDVFHQATPTHGRRLATHLMKRLPTCPIPEIARLGRTLRNGRTHSTPTSTQPEPATHPTEAINEHYRTRYTHHQRLPQPHQLPTPNTPHRKRPRCLHPHPTLKSRQSDVSG